ncbi:MAG: (Fe-S)-binding protein [Gemmatimonadota bacterium]
MRVALFATCLGDQFFADAVADSVRLLRHLGVEVEFPDGQTCCGQPAFNAGHKAEARRAAEHTLSTFESYDHIVLPSGSCAAMLREHFGHLLDQEGEGGGSDLGARSYELSQFIVQVLGVEELGRGLEGKRICYHHGCHALRMLGVRDAPLNLLRAAGADVLDWIAGEECCGFGGVFSVKVPQISAAMADRKLDSLPEADFVTSADGGCLLQLGGRARLREMAIPFRHLASVLWEAVGKAGRVEARV